MGALTLLITLAYWGLHQSQFIILDTDMYITDNPTVQAGLSFQNLWWSLTSFDAANWHPLTWVSHMIDTTLFGLNPAGHFIHNLVLHIANALLIYFIFKSISGRWVPAALIAAIFGVHPLNVENVAWIAERKTILAALFGLLAIAFYLTYLKHKKVGWYLCCLVSFGLSLMAKPMLVTLPCLFFLLDLWPLNRFKLTAAKPWFQLSHGTRWLPLILEKVPFFAFAAVSSWLTVLAQDQFGAIQSTQSFPLLNRFTNVIVAYARYLVDMVWPFDLALYYPQTYELLPYWQVAGALIFLVGMSAFVISRLEQQPVYFVSWFWYIGTFVPMIGIVQVGEMTHADRYFYFPAIGLFMGIFLGLSKNLTSPMTKKLITATTLVVIAGLAIRTHSQTQLWKTSRSIFEHTVSVTKRNHLIENNLGVVYFFENEIDRAIEQYEAALLTNPYYYSPFRNMGVAYAAKGKYAEAIEFLRQALTYHPALVEAMVDIGKIKLLEKDPETAAALFERSKEIDPGFVPAYLYMVDALGPLNPEALKNAEQALAIAPMNSLVHRSLGFVLYQRGEHERALPHFLKAIQLNPMLEETHLKLGILYMDLGSHYAAQLNILKEIEINPEYGNAYYFMGLSYLIQNKLRTALYYFSEALSKNPALVDAHYQIGQYFINSGNWEAARAAAEEGLSYKPDHEKMLFALSKVHLQEKDYLSAVNDLSQLAEKSPCHAEVFSMLGDAYLGLGDLVMAEENYSHALELAPTWNEVQKKTRGNSRFLKSWATSAAVRANTGDVSSF